MREKALINEITLAASNVGVPLWRNNVGVADMGNYKIRYGLSPGSADLIGVIPPHGRFFAVEVKTPNTAVAAHQKQWLDAVEKKHGGVAIVARTVDHVLRAIEDARRGVRVFYAVAYSAGELDLIGWGDTTREQAEEIAETWDGSPSIYRVVIEEV